MDRESLRASIAARERYLARLNEVERLLRTTPWSADHYALMAIRSILARGIRAEAVELPREREER